MMKSRTGQPRPSTDVGTRALVLAGGGISGIAWEIGFLAGLADQASGLADYVLASDVIVGTSAGAAVAAQITSGAPLQELFQRQTACGPAELDPGVSIDTIAALFVTAMSAGGRSMSEKRRHVAKIAVKADTVAESVRRAVIANRLPCHEWPDRTLRITAVDVASGELEIFNRESSVSIVDAVAASCAVPGAWPPVTIGNRRFMDGGVGSIVNTAVAHDCGNALVLVPSGEGKASPFGVDAAGEIAAFPGSILAVFADDCALAAFGSNPLDPACRMPSALAGHDQGQRSAELVAHHLAYSA